METVQQEIDFKVRNFIVDADIKRIDENHYKIVKGDNTIDVRREINYNFKAVLSICINNLGYFSGVNFDDLTIQLWLHIAEKTCRNRSDKVDSLKKQNRALWDSLIIKKEAV